MNNPAHPLYSLIRFLAVLGAVTVVLYANASNFDETELRAIGEIGLAIVAGKAGSAVFSKKES